MRRLVAFAVCAVFAVGCAASDPAASPSPSPATTGPTPTATAAPDPGATSTPTATSAPDQTPSPLVAPPGGVLVVFDGGTVAAEVADEPAERQTGLMHRESMEADAGMLFVFEGRVTGGFWMKNTLIPLQIAYMREAGENRYEVVAIMDMVPCEADPCPSYDPETGYDVALEVNEGWFDAHGVGTGAIAEVQEGADQA